MRSQRRKYKRVRSVRSENRGNRTESEKIGQSGRRKAITDAIVTRNDEGGILFAFYDVACARARARASIKPLQLPSGRVI